MVGLSIINVGTCRYYISMIDIIIVFRCIYVCNV